MCVQGADVIRDEVILKLKDKPLSSFSVFLPMVGGDAKRPAESKAKELAKFGVRSFWDGQRELGRAYAKTMQAPKELPVAWDVYFIYGPDAVWKDSPPKPDFWMHQLIEDDELCLDGPKFRIAVEEQLKKVQPTKKRMLLTREGCGATSELRRNVDRALKELGSGWSLELVDLDKLATDDLRRGYPTPTLLLDNKDVFGLPEPTEPASPG